MIMCAADTVRVNPSSIIMIHQCWSIFIGSYNADEMRKAVEFLDAVDRSQVTIFKRKTGISEAEIIKMMSEETYMTGNEAVAKGFADEFTEDKPMQIAASADRRTLFVNGNAMKLPYPLPRLPEVHL